MSGAVQAAVALNGVTDRDAIESLVVSLEGVDIVGFVDGSYDGFGGVAEPDADVLVLACGVASDSMLGRVEAAVQQRPGRPVVVLFDGPPNGLLRRVFEIGAEDVFALPADGRPVDWEVVSGQLAFTVQKAVHRKSGAAAAASSGNSRMICVLGPKGGTGKTLTAANLAVALAAQKNRVVVLDLDLQFGDVGLTMGLRPDRTLFDLARSSGSLDADKVEAYLARHECGVGVLLAPTRPDHASAISTEFLRDLYPVLRSMADYVIVDTPPGFTPEVISAIDASSDVCMVSALDALALKNTKLGLETLALMGYEPERVRFVLNRADSNVGLNPDEAVAIVGRHPDVLVPSHRDVVRAVNAGSPVALLRGREVSRSFHNLALLYTAAIAAVNNDVRERGLFGRRKWLG